MISGVIRMRKAKPIKIRNGDMTIKFNNPQFRAWRELSEELFNLGVVIGSGELKPDKINNPSLQKVAELCVDFTNFFSYMAQLGNGSQVNIRMDKK